MRTTERSDATAVLLGLTLALLISCAGDASKSSAPHDHAETGSTDAQQSHPESEAHDDEIPESVHLTGAAIAESGIQTWKVQPMDLEHLLLLTGTVEANENRLLQVAATVRGRVAAIPVDFGQWVKRGEPIAWIESVDLSHAWDEYIKALTELQIAERASTRARSLLDGKAISVGEYQRREAAYLSSKAEVDTLERALRQYGEGEDEISAARARVDNQTNPAGSTESAHRVAVRAPFDGRVIDRKVTAGALVDAHQLLATVADLSTVWVFLNAYEKDLALLSRGLEVTARTDAYPQEAFVGRVDFIGSLVDRDTRTVRVRATVRNPAEKLRPGMFVKATVDVPKPASELHPIVAVPQSSLQSLEGRSVVFVESERGTYHKRVVEIGHTFEGFTEILAGIAAGDIVVTEGSFVLKSEFAKATLLHEDH